ncbi:signal peptidase I [Candidatus Woesearchaeota archaeon]|jgi:hypothetical protein|nr:signal peptidase I [Candidatus Woesearchaeota archaeon]
MWADLLHKICIFLIIIILITLGWTANDIISESLEIKYEKPFAFSIKEITKSTEISSPSNHIKENQIHVYQDLIILDIKNASWGSFTDTNSMDPFLDQGSNSIEIKPTKQSQIQVGDIISYENSKKEIIIHRVIEKGLDSEGTYYILKGDNNQGKDHQKVRFNQIKGILVGIIY